VAHYKDMVPCIRFVQVSVASESGQFCSEKPGIFIRSGYQGCWAHVGFQDPKRFPTTLNLQTNWCDTIGVAVHELGHSLGMLHEQVRADSYKYVKILWQNIQSSYRQYYKVDTKADTSVPYDYLSVMHYADTDFGLPKYGGGRKTTMKKLTSSMKTMGNRMGLTHADAVQIAKTYGCARPKDFKVCAGSGGCTKGPCICHQVPTKQKNCEDYQPRWLQQM